jgi:undecaprenyl-diphosphatase
LYALLSSVAARFVIVEFIRLLYERERPFVAGGYAPLIAHEPTPAFPSGHVTFFSALTIYFLLERSFRMGAFLALSTLVISAGRVAAGLHWPTDILAGWAVGAAVAFVVWRSQKREKNTINPV